MKKIKILSLFVCLAMLAIACHNEDDERGLQLRTVLVYIAGDNSLRSFATEDLAEMTEGMQSVDDNSYNLLVYIDTGSGPKLIRLKKDNLNIRRKVMGWFYGPMEKGGLNIRILKLVGGDKIRVEKIIG